jgi:hypothetical protein
MTTIGNMGLTAAWLVALVAPRVLDEPRAQGTSGAAADQPASPAASAASIAADAKEADERPAPTPAEIAAWINDLDDHRYRVRERATQQLLAAGTAALDPLLAAANGELPEQADRARWILQQFAKDDDLASAVAALERLVKLRDRPSLVAQAQSEITRITMLICRRGLESLGAEWIMAFEPGMPGPILHVRLGGNWRGTTDDLQPLAKLPYSYIRLEGAVVDDAAVKLFEARDELAWLQLWHSKVSVAAVDSLKAQHPDAEVYLKNQALMGVRCRNHAAGALVVGVEMGTSADAAGVAVGDVITAVDGQAVPDFDRVTAHIAQRGPGDVVQLEVLRGEEKKSLSVKLGSWKQFEGR